MSSRGAPRSSWVIGLVTLLVLVASACADPSPTTLERLEQSEPPTPADASEPDAADPDAPDDSDGPDRAEDNAGNDEAQGGPGNRPVPPLVVPPTAPGTDEAWDDLVAELDRFITDEQREAGVPWPDPRSADPVTAYQRGADFQNWMSENNATPSLVEAYTAPGSPERGWDIDLFANYSALDILSTPSNPPYSMRVEALVHPAATGITDALLDQVPDGSVAVVYWDSVGTSQLVRPDGTVFGTDTGWTDLGPWVAIMAPTEVGWQVWWDELTEPPPPGDDHDRGLPQEQPDRRDV